jgi:vancomycin resistance protein YoaR
MNIVNVGKATKIVGLVRQAWIVLLPLALYGLYILTNPFSTDLAQKKIPTSSLTIHQRLNIQKAAEKIDGLILRPGEEFSFNKCVGPRTNEAGFYSAPSYIGGGSYSTSGGGICVVSSALYQNALIAGLRVSQRIPHQRTMQTVEPGLDATVWYGGADLKFVNDTSSPIQIQCKANDDFLTASLRGASPVVPMKLARRETPGGNNQIAVEVFQGTESQSLKLVSRDLYLLNSPKHRIGSQGNRAAL